MPVAVRLAALGASHTRATGQRRVQGGRRSGRSPRRGAAPAWHSGRVGAGHRTGGGFDERYLQLVACGRDGVALGPATTRVVVAATRPEP